MPARSPLMETGHALDDLIRVESHVREVFLCACGLRRGELRASRAGARVRLEAFHVFCRRARDRANLGHRLFETDGGLAGVGEERRTHRNRSLEFAEEFSALRCALLLGLHTPDSRLGLRGGGFEVFCLLGDLADFKAVLLGFFAGFFRCFFELSELLAQFGALEAGFFVLLANLQGLGLQILKRPPAERSPDFQRVAFFLKL